MTGDRKLYRWFYDNIHCRYYNLLVKWCFLPLGGENKVRYTLLEAVTLQRGDKILDVGCGTGNVTFAIAEKAGSHSKVVGIDSSSGQIRIAKKNNRFPNIEFMIMDASHTCFFEESFDKILISHAIHEMPRATRLFVLEEARRILKDGGTLVVLEVDDPNNPFLRLFFGFWWFYWLPFNFETPTRRDMFKHGLTEEIRAAGFNNVYKISIYKGVLQVVLGQK